MVHSVDSCIVRSMFMNVYAEMMCAFSFCELYFYDYDVLSYVFFLTCFMVKPKANFVFRLSRHRPPYEDLCTVCTLLFVVIV